MAFRLSVFGSLPGNDDESVKANLSILYPSSTSTKSNSEGKKGSKSKAPDSAEVIAKQPPAIIELGPNASKTVFGTQYFPISKYTLVNGVLQPPSSEGNAADESESSSNPTRRRGSISRRRRNSVDEMRIEIRGKCAACDQDVTTYEPRVKDEVTKEYYHEWCVDMDSSFRYTVPVKNWGQNQVLNYLKTADLSEYRKMFFDEGINGLDLTDLNDDDLKSMGIRKASMRRLILVEVRSLCNPQGISLDELILPSIEEEVLSTDDVKCVIRPASDHDILSADGVKCVVRPAAERSVRDLDEVHHEVNAATESELDEIDS